MGMLFSEPSLSIISKIDIFPLPPSGGLKDSFTQNDLIS